MDVYIKKYFFLVPIAVVICCAVFTAKAVNHVVEANALKDSEKVATDEPKSRTPRPKKPAKKRNKDGEAIAKRNMFCSECSPPEPVIEDAVASDGSPPNTSLPLRLVATNVSTDEQYSFATIQNTSTNRQGAYSLEKPIPDGGKIVRITAKFVDFENTSTKRVERISLLTGGPAPKVAATSSKPRRGRSKPKDELMAMIDEGVKKVDETSFEIDKKVVDKILENPMSVARGARIVPSIKNGKANGFKLYAIRPSSVYAKIGLRNGDTIHSINGFDLTSPDKALEVYTKVREARNLSVNATRRGKPISLSYSIK
jgi:general secretion pathway protein C